MKVPVTIYMTGYGAVHYEEENPDWFDKDAMRFNESVRVFDWGNYFK